MRTLMVIVLWCLLLLLCWPLAILALFVLPFVWFLLLPFRIVGVVIEASLAFIKALLYLPARVLGHRSVQ